MLGVTSYAGRALQGMTDAEWLDRQVSGLPAMWQDLIGRDWRNTWAMEEGRRRDANLRVLRTVAELQDAQRAGLRLDATDADICQRAEVFARHYQQGAGRGARFMHKVAGFGRDHSIGVELAGPVSPVVWALQQLQAHGMWDFWPGWKRGKPGDPDPKKTPEACLARVCCARWWRRTLRKLFARTVESCSIGLGLVSKARHCYVSNLSVSRRRQQVARNAAAMEATELENEFGQRMSVADLAAKSTANKTIRRAELMTRVSGFDLIAQEVGHEATFVTVTCPSRMHKWSDRGHRVAENPKFDGTTPDRAHRYLAQQWARCRAFLKRRGVELYGFRVVEPHHDGCPHWHMLLFHPSGQLDTLTEGLRRYFLANDSATERGAEQHRVKVEAIDRTKGSAASYIAKYIAKSIDGYGVGEDLFGAPAVESSARVDAWASTWRVRQFQQLGGAPVTVWRELRRINVEELPAGLLPEQLTQALQAVNVRDADPEAKWAAGWAAYTRAQGGTACRRGAHAVRLLKLETGEVNRYTEVRPADVVGVSCMGRNWHKPRHLVERFGPEAAPRVPRPAIAALESERCQWRQVGAGESLPAGEAGRPWTRVNNCTAEAIVTPEVMRSAVRFQRGKLGRWRPRSAPEAAPGGFPASTGVMT